MSIGLLLPVAVFAGLAFLGFAVLLGLIYAVVRVIRTAWARPVERKMNEALVTNLVGTVVQATVTLPAGIVGAVGVVRAVFFRGTGALRVLLELRQSGTLTVASAGITLGARRSPPSPGGWGEGLGGGGGSRASAREAP